MIKKSERLCLTLLLCLSLTNITGNQAFADNTLNQVDVKRNTNDGLEFTLYTSSPYADNVVVTKKSDNKYVILMPNVNNAQNSKPDFSAVKDIVSDLDVRSVNDGQGGYTKVTVITNRPVEIKTNTAKTAPVTQEQREYRALIAQQKSKPTVTPPPAISEKKETTGFKLPEIQPTKTASDIATAKETIKKAITENNIQKSTTKQEPKPAVEKKIAKAEKKQLKELNNIIPTSLKKTENQPTAEPQKEITSNEKNEIKNTAKEAEKIAATTTKIAQTNKTQENVQANQNKPDIIPVSKSFSAIKEDIIAKMPPNMPLTLALIFIPLLCIIALFNIIKLTLRNSKIIKKSFIENISKQPQTTPTQDYTNIINNENLNWQEKYQQYMGTTDKQNKAPNNDPKYKFVANKKPAKEEKVEYIIEEETQSEKLDRILQASPSVEKTNIETDIEEIENNLAISDKVANEADNIHNELNRTIKLKAFAEKIALEETHRNKKIKHRRVHLEIPKEMPHINLGYSQLHTNPRMFKNATLSVSDLIAKSNKLLNIKPEFKEDKNDYEMISVDEYFNIIEKDKSKITSPLSNVVANSFDNKTVKTQKAITKQTKKTTNPIQNPSKTEKADYLSGLIIKSGFNIDKERGFYLVSLDGKSAVIGKVKDEIFVLKKFDRNINKPLQVRQDNPNVYMVKADNFKSLVEVNKSKMGVLIEL